MSWKTKPTETNYEKPPVGAHPSVLVAIIDLGTHRETFKQSDQSERVSESRKLYFVWELLGVLKSGSKEPHVVGERFTLSLGKKAKLRALVEGWRGKALAGDEEFDPAVLLGKPCNVTLVENGEYVNFKGVGPIMKGQTVAKPFHALTKFVIGEDVKSLPPWLPRCYGETLAEIIASSKEMKQGTRAHPDEQEPVGVGEGQEIPF